ncbi:MAG: hypothetical protein GX335_04425 [Firmicutes bacterium]|nr:hypothetical protein [Bacillota bacterium]
MVTSEQKVRKWIGERFCPDCLEIKPFPILPGGTLIKDSSGDDLFVFYDVLADKVAFLEGRYRNADSGKIHREKSGL